MLLSNGSGVGESEHKLTEMTKYGQQREKSFWKMNKTLQSCGNMTFQNLREQRDLHSVLVNASQAEAFVSVHFWRNRRVSKHIESS